MEQNSEYKTCPYCGEQIKRAAILCRYCDSELPEEKAEAKDETPVYNSARPFCVPPDKTAVHAKAKNTVWEEWKFIIWLSALVFCIAFIFSVFLVKARIDYDGEYARDRLVYTKKYGFTVLVTYKTAYQVNVINGYAHTNIPFRDLFSEKIRGKYDGNDEADSLETLKLYQAAAEVARGFDIGAYGKYLIFEWDK